MIREILLCGAMHGVCIDDKNGNVELVHHIRDILNEKFAGNKSFDIFVDGNGRAMLLFLIDGFDDEIRNSHAPKELTRIVTGEGIDNFELEYPIADMGGIIKAEEFGKLWSLNNKSYGGDNFVVEKISITCTRMEIIIRFLNV